MEKNSKIPAIAWLKMPGYMHGWLRYELAGSWMVSGKNVLSVQHLSGAREVLRMETAEDLLERKLVGNSMSATWWNVTLAGLELDPEVTAEMYGVSRELMEQFVPIECPKMCLTRGGVLRPWTLVVNFGKRQATELQELLRREFWRSVEEFDADFAGKMDGKGYPAVKMIEAFCEETGTQDVYVEAMRREWQRRCKRSLSPTLPKEGGSSSPQ